MRNIVLAPHGITPKRGSAGLGSAIPQEVLLLVVPGVRSAWVHPRVPLRVWPTRGSVYVFVGVGLRGESCSEPPPHRTQRAESKDMAIWPEPGN